MFHELSLDQRRQLIDAQMAFGHYREVRAAMRERVRGCLMWRQIAGRRYLISKSGGKHESLGLESPALVERYDAFQKDRIELRARKNALAVRLAEMRPLNVAFGIGRVPDLSARIIDALDRAGLLGTSVRIVGTTALFAYEAAAGVQLERGLVTTGDLDLMLDAERTLQIAVPAGVDLASILRSVDRSFSVQYGEFAVNNKGFEVDLLRPTDDNRTLCEGEAFERICISERGNPIMVSAPRPSHMADHKAWLGKQASRNRLKFARDLAQAEAIKKMVATYGI
jgi:hypothetical protein